MHNKLIIPKLLDLVTQLESDSTSQPIMQLFFLLVWLVLKKR